MEVIPAIDLKGGRCVRLYQGVFDKEEVFSEDPVRVALRWQEEGAPRLHIVDLNGAARGQPANLGVISAIAARVEVPLQVGGGIRSAKTARRVLGMGVRRLVLSTAAVERPRLIAQMLQAYGPEAILVSVDAREGVVAIKGWREASSLTALEFIQRSAELGVRRFVYTDITRDGTLTEPNFQAIAQVVEKSRLPILASGGISSLEHLRRLHNLGVEGAIVGKALYTGAIKLSEAIASLK